MPDIVIKNAEGNDEVWENVNTVRFRENQTGNLISYRYDPGEAPTPEREDLLPAPEGMHWVGFLDGNGDLFWNNLVDDGGSVNYPPTNPEAPEDDMEFLRWNYSLEDLSVIKQDTVVGPVYKFKNFSEDQTVLKLLLPYTVVNGLSFYVNTYKVTSLSEPIVVQIDWGDGTAPDNLTLSAINQSVSISHSYNNSANYGKTIYMSITRISGPNTFHIGYYSSVSTDEYANKYNWAQSFLGFNFLPQSIRAIQLSSFETWFASVLGSAYFSEYLMVLADELNLTYLTSSNVFTKLSLLVLPKVTEVFGNWMNHTPLSRGPAMRGYSINWQDSTRIYSSLPTSTYAAKSDTARCFPLGFLFGGTSSLGSINTVSYVNRIRYWVYPHNSESYVVAYDYTTGTRSPTVLCLYQPMSGKSRLDIVLPNFGVPYYSHQQVLNACTGSGSVHVYSEWGPSSTNNSYVAGLDNCHFEALHFHEDVRMFSINSAGVISYSSSLSPSYFFMEWSARKLYFHKALFAKSNISCTLNNVLMYGGSSAPIEYLYINSAILPTISFGWSNSVYGNDPKEAWLTLHFGPDVTTVNWSSEWIGVKELIYDGNGMEFTNRGPFYQARRLNTKVSSIPDNVTRFGDYAYYYCGQAHNIHIPASVTQIGNYFCSETPISQLWMHPIIPPSVGSYLFSGTTWTAGVHPPLKIHVPQGSLSAYQSATNWSVYAALMVDDIIDE